MKQAFVPIERIRTLKEDLERFRQEQPLNGYQQYILDKIYHWYIPDLDFEPKSVGIVAAQTYASRPVTIEAEGNRYRFQSVGTMIDPEETSRGIETKLNAEGVRAAYIRRLPLKRLAVCAGIAAYGRNNITYVEGMGSYHTLYAFFTDHPCESDPWRDVVAMDRCEGCGLCVRACPTGAVRPDRFLLDNERCITSINEGGEPEVFPDWIPLSAHNAVVECLLCQRACPANAPYADKIGPGVSFDEAETKALLAKTPYEALTESLQEKVDALDWKGYLSALQRNLKALIEKEKAGL